MLCHSLAGNAVYVVTVTSQGSAGQERTKRAVVVTARVHPGETNASWMMEGFLDFLLGDSDDARLLRDTFVFKVRKVSVQEQLFGEKVHSSRFPILDHSLLTLFSWRWCPC